MNINEASRLVSGGFVLSLRFIELVQEGGNGSVIQLSDSVCLSPVKALEIFARCQNVYLPRRHFCKAFADTFIEIFSVSHTHHSFSVWRVANQRSTAIKRRLRDFLSVRGKEFDMLSYTGSVSIGNCCFNTFRVYIRTKSVILGIEINF